MKMRIIAVAIFGASIAIAMTFAFRVGFKRGVAHAIEDSEHFVLDTDVHDAYDYDLHIFLDDDHYLTTLFVG